MKYGKSLNRTEIYINIYQNVWFVIKVSHREKIIAYKVSISKDVSNQ